MNAPLPAGAAGAAMRPRDRRRGSGAIAALFACCPWPTIALWGLIYVPFAGLTAFVALTARGPFDSRVALFAMLCPAIGTGVLWLGWVSRLLLLHIEARTSRMPGLAQAASLAMTLMFAATVLLPGALLAAKGVPWTLAFGALAVAALAGLLAAWLPAMATSAVFLAPLVFSGLSPRLPAMFARLELTASSTQLVPLALLLALLALWRARALVRIAGEGRALSRLQRPMLLGGAYGDLGSMRTQDGKDRELARANMAWTAARVLPHSGPDEPVLALRTWLGPPFIRRSLRYWLLQAGFAALIVLLLGAVGADLIDMWPIVLGGAALAWVLGSSVDPIPRLRYLQGSQGGEFALLGVLPGWGDGAAARRLMLRAAFGQRLWRSLPALPVLIGVLAWRAAPAAHYVLLALMFTGTLVIAGAFGLRTMMGGARSPVLGVIALFAGLGLLLPAVLVLGFGMTNGLLTWMLIAWSVALLAGSVSLLRAWGRWRTLPHPFLQQ